MKNVRLILIDGNSYTSSVLVDDLERRGFDNIQTVSNTLDLPPILTNAAPDAVIFNYQSDKPDSLSACATIKLLAPQAVFIAIVSPGPPLKAVRAWSQQMQCIDIIIEKPLLDELLFKSLTDALNAKVVMREMLSRTERLSNMLPEAAITLAESRVDNDAELFEAAVLFTDVRGSSRLIRQMPPRDFFVRLNQMLSSQGGHVVQHQGSVIKYTGDGLMAIFRGMGRSYLALKCALELARTSDQHELPFGVGVAEGLVLAGLIGDSRRTGQRRQYDVIGATAHLAARLCGLAEAGEVVATKNMNIVAKVSSPSPRTIGNVSIRGFDAQIDCVAFKPSIQNSGAA